MVPDHQSGNIEIELDYGLFLLSELLADSGKSLHDFDLPLHQIN
jgi:hypothetical protein